MQAAPLPSDETQRLAVLDELRIEDRSGERFDQVTRLTAEIFQVPIAFVSFVGRDRQWFKSTVGLEVSETPRAISFCAHAILGEEVLVIPDTRKDPRFADNPLVTGDPFLRFYVGCPLRAPGGEKIGTLCIADHIPHEVSAEQVHLLPRLAALIEHELRMGDVIESQRKLIKTQRRLRAELQEAAKYVRSWIPPPINQPVVVDWRFLPSEELGGDCLGYHFLGKDKLALYVVDVCGHGIGAALLAVSVLDALRLRALPEVKFTKPAAVLTALNREFPMARHGRYFTIWYGVLDFKRSSLTFSTAGHPPGVLIRGNEEPRLLATAGIPIGCLPDPIYKNQRCVLEAGDVLYLYSDGAFELQGSPRRSLGIAELSQVLARAARQANGLDAAMTELALLNGSERFIDDVSLLSVQTLSPSGA